MNEQYLKPERIRVMEAFSYPKSGVIIADAKVNDVYRHYFELKDPLPSLFLKAGERFKSLNSLRKIYDFLTAHNVHRSETIHVFGGGMICDLAAYAVATFKRGCRLKLYPTTLLAMVDAAIGGKCAINYQQLKNHIGAFYPAEEIIIHPTFLDSLKATEIRQGMAEMLKCYLICDRLSELELLSGRIPETKQILEYANFKMSICAKDPFDQGIRRSLNFGHTIGHVLEASSNYRFKHGDCVLIGMILASQMSYKLGFIDATAFELYEDALSHFLLPAAAVDQFLSKLSFPEILHEARQDKKNSNNILTMVLPVAYRKVEIQEIDLSLCGGAW